MKFCTFLALLLVLVLSSRAGKIGTTGTTNGDLEAQTSALAWPPATKKDVNVRDLHQEYSNIFRYGNRNAASHLWVTFLLQRSDQMTSERLDGFLAGFCAVSGSPVRPSDYNRYRLTLPRVGGGFVTGNMHYCCWPCVCDTQDFIRIDTLNVTTRKTNHDESSTVGGGENDLFETKQRFVAVIGNPCDRPEQLREPFVQPFYGGRKTTLVETAAEVRCGPDGKLEGATLSDHGYVVISVFFDAEEVSEANATAGITKGMDDPGIVATSGSDATLPPPQPGRITTVAQPDGSTRVFQDEREFGPRCADRARNGYNSGMGEIFRRVCAISPIAPEALAASSLPALGTVDEPSCDAAAALDAQEAQAQEAK